MKLADLSEEKKERIIQALLDEYSAYGYEQASTNNIVKAAGISKGSLFNYIGSKEKQYQFIVSYVMSFFQTTLAQWMSEIELPSNYLDILMVRSKVKIRMGLAFPKKYKLLMDAYMNPPEAVRDALEKESAMLTAEALEKEKAYLDPSLLKDPNLRDEVVEMIFYMISGYSDMYLKQHKEIASSEVEQVLKDMTDDMKRYFDIFKQQFFK